MAKVTHEIKEVLISDLKEFKGNPNQHPKSQIEALAKSMERYGQYYNVICDEKLTILAGHGKVLALKHLGETKAKVTIIKGLTQKEKTKLVIEDNKIQTMSFVSFDAVEELIKQVGDTDILGFDASYLENVFAETSEAIEKLPDNMGVRLDQPAKVQPTYTEEEVSSSALVVDDIEEGMQVATTHRCPHCGKEIVL